MEEMSDKQRNIFPLVPEREKPEKDRALESTNQTRQSQSIPQKKMDNSVISFPGH